MEVKNNGPLLDKALCIRIYWFMLAFVENLVY
jgi:hypothetical protein